MHSTAARYFDVDNYVVSASTMEGPWSPPVYLNSVGFDPSLFHDDDGRHWLVALEWDPRTGYEHPGAIVLDEYDPQLGRLVGESRRIYRGGSNRGCLEAPHLYRHDGQYYLMAAEGGTGYAHGVTLARSAGHRGAVRTRSPQPLPDQQPGRHPRSQRPGPPQAPVVQPGGRAAEGRSRLPGEHPARRVVRGPPLRAPDRPRPPVHPRP